MSSGAKTPSAGGFGDRAHVGVALAAPFVVLAVLAADPRWASVQPQALDPGRSRLAELWLVCATALPLLDVTHRAELALHASIAALAILTALIASSLHEGRARVFVSAAAGTLVTVSASHWIRWHLAASNRVDYVIPSLVAAIALAGALLSLRDATRTARRTTRVAVLLALGAMAGADTPHSLDPWPCVLVAASLLATSWERITARTDGIAPTRSSLASVAVSLLALGVAAVRGPWVEEPVAATRSPDSFARRVSLTGPPPRDLVLIHDGELRRELRGALSPMLRPDVAFVEPADVWRRGEYRSGSPPHGANEWSSASAEQPTTEWEPRGVTSDAFWLPSATRTSADLNHVHEMGPLFRHDPDGDGLTNTAPRWVSMAATDAKMPLADRAWLALSALERARFRRATGRPELAVGAWPFSSTRDRDLRERLRLAWLVRASTSPARASVTITAAPLRLSPKALADPVVAHTIAEIEAAELAYELGRDGLARTLVDDAASAGRIEAIVALVRWQAHTGARAAFDENAATLLGDPVGRRYAFDTVHWLLREGFDDVARALATTASPRDQDAAAHTAAILAVDVAAARGGSLTR